MLSGVSWLVLTTIPVQSAPSRVDVDRFHILLATHFDIQQRGVLERARERFESEDRNPRAPQTLTAIPDTLSAKQHDLMVPRYPSRRPS